MQSCSVDYKKVYEILDSITPLKCDCGILCGNACCNDDEYEEEMGMYLLPGEEIMHDKNDPCLIWTKDNAVDYDFPMSWTGTVDFVKCEGPKKCKRNLRPIQCRTFPLTAHLTKDKKLIMIMVDEGMPYSCPLFKIPGSIEQDFINAAATAWKILIQDKLIYDLVEYDSAYRDETGIAYTVCEEKYDE